ncbi:hypothetical protein SAMN02927930_00268 [Pseudidiomarina indica]|uniref:Uncharacterized protein n=1 Tax=Pseudidiomarina indica TaxID=1159017 RepID=A0A1G6ACD0_9GAMM|nr:hypothetical protein SAMN02927930_00268 [Pseudidiomarina indica]
MKASDLEILDDFKLSISNPSGILFSRLEATPILPDDLGFA